MGLNVARPPESALGIVRAKLPTLVDMLDQGRGGGRVAVMPWLDAAPLNFGFGAGRGLETSVGHRIFTFDPRDLARNDAGAHAEPVGWRYLILQGGKAVATVDLAGDPLRFSSFSSGPFVNSIRSAIDQAETIGQVREGDYQLRGLRIPGLRVAAIWLYNMRDHDNVRDSDLVIPIKGSPVEPVARPGAIEVQPYEVFLSRLGIAARSALEHVDATLSEDEDGPVARTEPPPFQTTEA